MRVQVTRTDFRHARIGLSPLGLHGWADLYYQEYGALPNISRERSVACLLLCRATELEFKAWHRQAGRPDGLVDRFRHDLIASYRELPKKHQVLSVDEVAVLEQANSFYVSQGFENAESQRPQSECPRDIDIGVLETVAYKAMEHGDRLSLKLW